MPRTKPICSIMKDPEFYFILYAVF